MTTTADCHGGVDGPAGVAPPAVEKAMEPALGNVVELRRRRRPARLTASALATGMFMLVTFVGPLVVADPTKQHPTESYRPPLWLGEGSARFILGTDQLGRDVLARAVHGLRSSVETGVLAVTVAAVVGVLVGLVAGYIGGWVDEVVMRLVDVQLAIPSIMLLLLVVSILRPSFATVVLVLAVLAWVVYIRVTRAEVLALTQQDMVVGLTAMGASSARIIIRHVLANVSGPLIAVTTIEFAQVIIAGAGLSYLGLGIPPPTPTLGGMISDGQGALTAGLWWPVVVPGALLAGLVLSLNALGESLRTYLDPRSRVSVSRPTRVRGRLTRGSAA